MRSLAGIFALLVAVLGASCSGGPPARPDCVGPPPADGTLTIAYTFGKGEKLQPSYQTAIWLEDADGRYFKTLFATDYVSYCGANYKTICPEWVGVAGWDQVSKAELDAVTGATPRVAPNSVDVDCRSRCIPPGVYRYCVETHITKNYNVLFRGTIELGNAEATSRAEATYIPEPHPRAGGVLREVEARYRPAPGPVGPSMEGRNP